MSRPTSKLPPARPVIQPALLPELEPPPAASEGQDLTTLDRTMTPDDARVHDALCVLQVPVGISKVSELLMAADIGTTRGTRFGALEVKAVMERLLDAGHVERLHTGQARARQPWAGERFRELMLDDARSARWYAAWKRANHVDDYRYLSLGDVAQCAAALRLAIYGGRKLDAVQRLTEQTREEQPVIDRALRQAVLEPFDAALFERLEPLLQTELADKVSQVLSGNVETGLTPLEDWLLARVVGKPAADTPLVPPNLRVRLAETLIVRADPAGARALCAGLRGPGVDTVLAAASVTEGHWPAGIEAFEAALKASAAATGRRRSNVSPALSWLYVMALLAQPEPAAWVKARKFVGAESGRTPGRPDGTREADPWGWWDIWVAAIDQRLGDAPRSATAFRLGRSARQELTSAQCAHHLLLAAWLRFTPADAAAGTELRSAVAALVEEFDAARMHWLARQVRRAGAALLHEAPAPADADTLFFVGSAQESWREALATILALGDDSAGAAAPKARDGALLDRLIWVLATDVDGRLDAIEAMEQKAGVRGLGKAKAVSLATLMKRKDLDARDGAVLRALDRDSQQLDPAVALPALVGHPHVAWARDPARLIEIREALPALEIMTQGEHITFRVLDPLRTERLRAEEAQDDLLPPRWRADRVRRRNLLLLPEADGSARLIRLNPAQLRVAELVSQGWKVPVAARAELDAAMRVLAAHFQVASDAEAGHEVPASTLLRAELAAQGGGLTLSLVAAPFGDFGPRLPPGSGRERVTTVHQGVTLSTRRALAAERAAVARVLDTLPMLEEGTTDWRIDAPHEALAVVEGLARLADQVVAEWPKGKPLRVRTVADAAVQLKAASRGDWLELDGQLQLDGGEVLRLRQLLDLARASRSRYVALGEGDFLALSDALRQQLSDLAALAQPHAGGQRLSGVAALAWQAAGHGALVMDGDRAWRERCTQWEQAQGQFATPPAGLAADLRDYQLQGYQWLMRLAASGFGAVLADDMGLGKTVQTLAVLLARAPGGAALVVAPTSVCGNWLAELARFAPGLQVELYGDTLAVADDAGEDAADDAGDEHGNRSTAPAVPDAPSGDVPEPDSARRAARRRQVRALGAGQLLVCSYALLQIDADILTAAPWHSVVLDEAQAIKNSTTRRARAAHQLQAGFRLALTGTPIENRLGELWSIMAFANPGLLGSAEQFNRQVAGPIERDGDPALALAATRRLRRLLAPFLLRRTKAEVLTDLPPRTEIVHEVVPGTRERALHEALRQAASEQVNRALAEGGAASGQARFHVLAALTRLRRAACDPRLVAPEQGIVGAKVLEFERLATELVAGRHKALVFSQFTDFLALLRERLDLAGLSYQYLDGSTPAADRARRVAAFQAGEGDLFLISLKAGGFGLNLTMADYVIIADPWWNPAAEEQASARAHRMGQQRPVTVYRLVTQGSIEEKIVRLHRSKRDLAEGILAEQDGTAPIDAGELMELLAPE